MASIDTVALQDWWNREWDHEPIFGWLVGSSYPTQQAVEKEGPSGLLVSILHSRRESMHLNEIHEKPDKTIVTLSAQFQVATFRKAGLEILNSLSLFSELTF